MSDREDYEENGGKKKGGFLATLSKVFTVVVLLAILGCAAVFLCFHLVPQLKGKSLFTVTELVNSGQDGEASQSEAEDASDGESETESEDSQLPEESSDVVSAVEEENTTKVFDGSEETIKNIVTYYRRGENVYEKEVETHKRIRRIIRYINKYADQVYFDGDYEAWFEEYSAMLETESTALTSTSEETSETENSAASSTLTENSEAEENNIQLEKGLLLSEADFSENTAMTSESGYESTDMDPQDADAETSESSLTGETSEETSGMSSLTEETAQETSSEPKILAEITMKSGKRIQVYGFQNEDYGIMWGGLDTFAHSTDDVE